MSILWWPGVAYLIFGLVVYAHIEIEEHIRERRWTAVGVQSGFMVAGYALLTWMLHGQVYSIPGHPMRPWLSIRLVVLAVLQAYFVFDIARVGVWHAFHRNPIGATICFSLALCSAAALFLWMDPTHVWS